MVTSADCVVEKSPGELTEAGKRFDAEARLAQLRVSLLELAMRERRNNGSSTDILDVLRRENPRRAAAFRTAPLGDEDLARIDMQAIHDLADRAERKTKPKKERRRRNGEQTQFPAWDVTENANAQRLIAHFGKDLLYSHPEGFWRVWDGTRWARDERGAVVEMMKEAVRRIHDEAAAVDRDTKESRALWEALIRHLRASDRATPIRNALFLAQSLVPVLPGELDRDPWLLNTLTGTIDLRDGSLRPHRREDRITKLAPVEYDPSAKCPSWERHLQKTLGGNQNLIAYLRRVTGYILTGLTSEHKVFFASGPGGTTKTTTCKVFQGLLGDYAIKTAHEMLMQKPVGVHSTEITDLRGCRLALTIEIQEGRRIAESLFKELTGGDSIRARRMYADTVQWEPSHKIIMAANHLPVVHETDWGFWRRIALVPFEHLISDEERIDDYHAELLKEAPGILGWALAGCVEWQKIGLAEPDEVKSATRAYRTDQDILGEWLDEACVVGPKCEATNPQLRDSYEDWCKHAGEKPLGSKTFSKRLEEKGFIRQRTGSRGRFWRGVGIRRSDT